MDNGCYWIALPGHMYRRDCDRKSGYCYETMLAPETESLNYMIGKACPNCGKPVYLDEHSYDLVKKDRT